MSDESYTHEPDMPQEGEPSMPEPAEEASASTMSMSDFSTGQGMVALSGIILLAVWLIFEVIMEEYFQPWIVLLLAAAAVILPRVNRANVEKLHPLPILMKTIGYALAIVGLFVIVDEVVDGIFGADGATIIGALLTYAAFVMAFMGARSVEA